MLLDPMLPTPIRMQLPLTTIRRHLTDILANRIASIPANGLEGREGFFVWTSLAWLQPLLTFLFSKLRSQLHKLTGH
jgi:hypothetical protein